jgi:hypothetical protein
LTFIARTTSVWAQDPAVVNSKTIKVTLENGVKAGVTLRNFGTLDFEMQTERCCVSIVSHEFHQTLLLHRRSDCELRGGKCFGRESAGEAAGDDRVGAGLTR